MPASTPKPRTSLLRARSLSRRVRLNEQLDSALRGHHELMKQLFYAERVVTDWRKANFMQEPPPQSKKEATTGPPPAPTAAPPRPPPPATG